MAIPEWVGRLRTASFVSPAGVESTFKLDIVSRVGGKKSSTHEILNSDEAIQQDQGNRSTSYPIEAYFTGTDGDLDADAFYASLEERYTTDLPGLLKHPRWGDIPVMPFEFQQSEQLVTGAGVFRVPVEFRRVPQTDFPTTSDGDTSEIVAAIDDLETTLETANVEIDVDNPSNYAQFKALITKITGVISDILKPIADTVSDIADAFNLVKDDIDTALSVGEDAVSIMQQVNRLMRIPSQIVDDTTSKVTRYYEMALTVIQTIEQESSNWTSIIDMINGGASYQSIVSVATAATAEAALFTDFQTREVAGEALDVVNSLESLTANGIAEIAQEIDGFDGDHNTSLDLTLLIGMVNETLIDISFDLRSKRTTILKSPSDAITLTWQFYADLEQLDFFINTNSLKDSELLEIPAGREIVSYG